MRCQLLAAILFAGCKVENEVVAELPDYGEVNPPDVPSEEWTDRILQVTVPKVDILWTIDDSSSMGNEQRDLVDSFPAFAEYFVDSGLDYHIGVITTDIVDPLDDGSLERARGYAYIDRETEDPVGVFGVMANVGIVAIGEECGIGATFHALEAKRETDNRGFYREDADLHTILISDEEDQTPPNVITADEFVGWYTGLKREGQERTFSSIVSFVDNPPADRGVRYMGVTEQIGGITWDIAAGEWPVVLDQLGLQAGGYRTEFFLSHPPVPEERENGVFIPHDRAVFDDDGNLVDGRWTWDRSRNSITFEQYVPEPLAVIAITYTLLAYE
jgi:hypothetical protein